MPASEIPDDWMGLDIGPDSVKTFSDALDTTKTIIWNGPMGVFEFDKFAVGTEVNDNLSSTQYGLTDVGFKLLIMLNKVSITFHFTYTPIKTAWLIVLTWQSIAKKLAELSGKGVTTIIGGGDSVAAVEKVGVADVMSHISTGGGASLELLEGKELPGVVALDEAVAVAV